MKSRLVRLVLSMVLAQVVILAMFAVLAGIVRAGDHCVDAAGSGGCLTTIQAAVDTAVAGDTIRVTSGTYYENVVIEHSLILLGGFDDTSFAKRTPRSSVVDGGGNGRVFTISGGADVTLDGFTVTHGDATGQGGIGGGIAVMEAAASIHDNLIENNLASSSPTLSGSGGGIYVISNTLPVAISNNRIRANIAQSVSLTQSVTVLIGNGGGIYLGPSHEVTISGNRILANTALNSNIPNRAFGLGGGIGAEGNELPKTTVVIKDNVIKNNIAKKAAGDGTGYGGGIGLYGLSGAAIRDNDIQSNIAASASAAGNGGGIDSIWLGNLTISGNNISHNIANEKGIGANGGGIRATRTQSLEITNNSVISNTGGVLLSGANMSADGGGIAISGPGITADTAVIEGNTIAGNIAVQTMNDTTAGSASYASGGGINASEVTTTTIANNRIMRNITVDDLTLAGSGGWGGRPAGGGVHMNNNDAVTFSDNIISYNLVARHASIDGVSSNANGAGIGLENVSEAFLLNNSISHNTGVIDGSLVNAANHGYYPSGGGVLVACSEGKPCVILAVGNTIAENNPAVMVTADAPNSAGASGAGIYAAGVTLDMTNNSLLHNGHPSNVPGGILALQVDRSLVTSVNDLFAANSNGIWGGSSTLHVTNGTLHNNGNVGVGSRNDSTVTVYNTIVSGHNLGLYNHEGTSTFTADYNLLDNSTNYAGGVAPGAHDIVDQSPLFVDADNDDFHLQKGSPAVEQGDNAVAPAFDFEGDKRPFDENFDGSAQVDIGADEAGRSLYLTAIFSQK